MSHYECSRCGGRFRDEHECSADGEAMLARIQELEAQLKDLGDKFNALVEIVNGLRVPRQHKGTGDQ